MERDADTVSRRQNQESLRLMKLVCHARLNGRDVYVVEKEYL